MSGRRLTRGERRERILAAATEVFAEAGYEGATLREVARRAQITTPVLYDHFTAKADLYSTLLDREIAALIEGWSAPDEAMAPFDLLYSRVMAIYAWIEANELGWRMIFGESPRTPELAEVHARGQQRATAQLAGLLARVPDLRLTANLQRERADEVLAEAAKSALNAIATWWWRNRDVPREEVVALTVDLLWRGLGQITDQRKDRQ
ncbi:transcriptional regulator, TetR family [Amycolatopsis marina]|uniref:Transcriptional regulator, TetR family n=1 Tax=Amycolatopsis marina TaxID=490629 RepID=A0A1I0XPJ3_9PSEU|nr:TetR/AcrR family transcriptional regulator [Amycolatopsis marina]SFB02597.1 transcriptional regulator, TetR family [Amycolatopsis marina]